MSRSLTFRPIAGGVVAAVGVEAIFSAATPDRPSRHRLLATWLSAEALPSAAHVLALVAGLALVVLAPKLWRGTRTAVMLTIGALLALAALNLVKGLDYEETALDVCLAALLIVGRTSFPLGCRKRTRLAVLLAAVGAWALAYCALLARPLVSDHGRTFDRALQRSVVHPHVSETWILLIEVLVAAAIAASLVAIQSLLKPASAPGGHDADRARAARRAVETHGRDSLAPFILRPDKAFHIHRDTILAYRVLGETAIVSGDPVGPADQVPDALSSFRDLAGRRGWHTVIWGASTHHLAAYRAAGLHAVCAGEEAFIDPTAFTLEGRRVRKLRQSVHRLTRRGWRVEALAGCDLDAATAREVDELETRWRSTRERITGFAMAMGPYDPARRPDDLYLLARAPEGDLRAVMRFAVYVGGLSLDTMRRVGDTPNGLNEALVCGALELARERGIPEVSLNYAGLAHIVRGTRAGGALAARLGGWLVERLARRFQMARLVAFDEKFFPEWRRRYLVYESQTALPRAILRVMQAEGYVPESPRPSHRARGRRAAAGLSAAPRTDAAT